MAMVIRLSMLIIVTKVTMVETVIMVTINIMVDMVIIIVVVMVVMVIRTDRTTRTHGTNKTDRTGKSGQTDLTFKLDFPGSFRNSCDVFLDSFHKDLRQPLPKGEDDSLKCSNFAWILLTSIQSTRQRPKAMTFDIWHLALSYFF